MTDHCLVRYQCILHCCIIVQVSLRSRHEIITQQATGLQISGHIYLSYLLLQDFKSCFFKKKKKLKRKKRSLSLGQSLVYCCKCLFVVVSFLASTQVLISVVMIPDIAFLLSQLNPCWHMSWAKLFVIFWWHADLVNYVAAVNGSCFLQWGVDVDSLLSHCLIGEFLKGFGPSLCLWPVLSISDTVAVYRQTTWSGCS